MVKIKDVQEELEEIGRQKALLDKEFKKLEQISKEVELTMFRKDYEGKYFKFEEGEMQTYAYIKEVAAFYDELICFHGLVVYRDSDSYQIGSYSESDVEFGEEIFKEEFLEALGNMTEQFQNDFGDIVNWHSVKTGGRALTQPITEE